MTQWTPLTVLLLVALLNAVHKYGDATFYCWLREIQLMFLTFYVFYVAMVVFNFVLLVLIHVNMKQRVARYVRGCAVPDECLYRSLRC